MRLWLSGLLTDERLWDWVHQAEPVLAENSLIPDITFSTSMAGLAAGVLAQTEGPLELVGFSMGGYVTLEVMRHCMSLAPDRVGKVAFVCTNACQDAPEMVERRERELVAIEMGEFKGVTARLMPSLVHPDHVNNQAITDLVVDMAKRLGRRGFLHQQSAIIGRHDQRPWMKQWNKPVLIISGAQDKRTPPYQQLEMAALFPHSKLATLDPCGHLAPLEQPLQTAKLLKDFFVK